MLFRLSSALALGSLVLSLTTAREITHEEVKRFTDDFFGRVIKQGQLPGAVVSVVKDGSVIYKSGYGYSDLESKSLADPSSTVVQVGSISKTFTATSLLQLYEKGLIELDQNINLYLRDEDQTQTFFLSTNNFKENVTASSLLTHTSGLDTKMLGTATIKPQNIPSSILPALENFPLRVREVNETQSYSNHGYTLLGHTVSKISKLPFAEYVRQHILEPLGMDASTFAPHNASDPTTVKIRSSEKYKFAVAYGKNPKTNEFERAPELYIALVPAGALVSTAEDMSKFMIAHLNHGSLSENQRILDPDTIDLMHSRQFGHNELIDGTCYGFFETNYGPGLRMISHGGDTVGQSSQMSLFPDKNLGIFVSYNVNDIMIRKEFVENFISHFYEPSESADPYDEEFFQVVPHWDYRAEYYEATFRPVGVSHSSFEKLISLEQQIVIKGYPDNILGVILPQSLQPLFGTDEVKLREVARHTFKVIDPISPGHMSKQYFTFKFDRELGGAIFLYAGSFDLPIVFERIEWYEKKIPQLSIFAIALSIMVIEAFYHAYFLISNYLYGREKSQFSYQKINGKKSKKVNKAKDSDDEEEDDTPEEVKSRIEEEKRKKERLAELQKKYVIPDDANIDDYEKTENNFSFKLLPQVPGILAWLYVTMFVSVGCLGYYYDLYELISLHRLPEAFRLVFMIPFAAVMVTVMFARHLFCWWGEIPGYQRQHRWFLAVLIASCVLLYFIVSNHLIMIHM
ncbi:hypothetical protein K7432_002755 [Basidiobolus ranarum]|uniref:Beta-lactamase-related domain-containing protein n=1 Tax=Basidiobolus ranarum TaxID=34480 RepID=A0ABR2X0Z6_9FUNG